MLELDLATGNPDKLKEFEERLGRGIRLRSLVDYPGFTPPEETGVTLEDNALLKARALYAHTGRFCAADDTGLMVDVLDGEPGVYSARWAGEHCSYEANVRKLLREMRGVPSPRRGAVFETVIAVVGPGIEELLKGSCRGRILEQTRGSGGFGYDPVFYCPEAGAAFAELDLTEKNRVSHRGRALSRLAKWIGRHAAELEEGK